MGKRTACFINAMSSSKDNPADPFKKALAETAKTLANDSEISVTFTVDPPGMSNEGIRLPQVTRRMTREEVLLARAQFTLQAQCS